MRSRIGALLQLVAGSVAVLALSVGLPLALIGRAVLAALPGSGA